MAISLTNSAENTANNATSIDISLTVSSGSGRVLIAWGLFVDLDSTSTDFTSIVFDPGGSDEASFTRETAADASQVISGTVIQRASTFYLVLDNGVSNGTYTVRVTANATTSRLAGVAWEVDGADTTDPIGASGTAAGVSDTPSASVTTTEDFSWIAAGVHSRYNSNATPGSGDTEVTDSAAPNNSRWTGYTEVDSAGTDSVSCTYGGNGDYCISAVEIKVGGGAAAYTLICAQGSFTYTGQTVSLLADRDLSLAQGSFTYTGQTVALERGFYVSMSQGSYTYSGQTVSLLVERYLALSQGSYTYTGQAVGVYRGYPLTCAQGSYTYTGQTVALTLTRLLALAQGSYTLTGQAVTLDYSGAGGYELICAQGSFTLAGQAVTLTLDRLISLAQGSYTLSGQAINLNKGVILTCSQGSYTYTGQVVGLTVDWLLSLVYGTIVLTGQAVSLDYSGDVAVTPAERIYIVLAESRSYVVEAETRTLTVPAETRTLTIDKTGES